jgi:hypothetical protein
MSHSKNFPIDKGKADLLKIYFVFGRLLEEEDDYYFSTCSNA